MENTREQFPDFNEILSEGGPSGIGIKKSEVKELISAIEQLEIVKEKLIKTGGLPGMSASILAKSIGIINTIGGKITGGE